MMTKLHDLDPKGLVKAKQVFASFVRICDIAAVFDTDSNFTWDIDPWFD